MRPKNSTQLVFWMLTICLCLSTTTSVFADTLEQAVNQTIATHPQILSAESSQLAANQDIKQEEGGYYPSVNITTGDGPEYSNNPATRASGSPNGISLFRQESNFLLSQLLFDGGNVTNRVAKAKADFQTSTFQVYQAEEALGYDAALAYLTVMQDRELLRIAALDVAAHQDMYSKIARRVEAGASNKSDLELVLSRLALAKSNYLQIQGKLNDDVATYFKVVGYLPSPYMEMPPQPKNLPMTLTQAQQLAVQLNPQLQASKAQVASNIAAVGVAKSAYFPTVTLDLNASYNDSLDGVPGYNNERAALVHMNYNVFRGGSDKAAVSAARYRVVTAQQDTQTLQRDILETVAFDWDGLQTALRRIPELRIHADQAYKVWQAYIKQFKLGQRTLFDLLNAQSEYYDGQKALVQAQYQSRIQRYKLLASIGEMVSTIKNPGFSKESSALIAPRSSIKVVKVTLPTNALNNTEAAGLKIPDAALSTPNIVTVTPGDSKTGTTPVLAIPSLTKPSTLMPTKATPVPAPTPKKATEFPLKPASRAKSVPYSKVEPSHIKTSHYRVQILASENKSSLARFAKQNHLAKVNYNINKTEVNHKTWYHLLYGNYDTIPEAKAKKQALMKQIGNVHPIIVKVT